MDKTGGVLLPHGLGSAYRSGFNAQDLDLESDLRQAFSCNRSEGVNRYLPAHLDESIPKRGVTGLLSCGSGTGVKPNVAGIAAHATGSREAAGFSGSCAASSAGAVNGGAVNGSAGTAGAAPARAPAGARTAVAPACASGPIPRSVDRQRSSSGAGEAGPRVAPRAASRAAQANVRVYEEVDGIIDLESSDSEATPKATVRAAPRDTLRATTGVGASLCDASATLASRPQAVPAASSCGGGAELVRRHDESASDSSGGSSDWDVVVCVASEGDCGRGATSFPRKRGRLIRSAARMLEDEDDVSTSSEASSDDVSDSRAGGGRKERVAKSGIRGGTQPVAGAAASCAGDELESQDVAQGGARAVQSKSTSVRENGLAAAGGSVDTGETSFLHAAHANGLPVPHAAAVSSQATGPSPTVAVPASAAGSSVVPERKKRRRSDFPAFLAAALARSSGPPLVRKGSEARRFDFGVGGGSARERVHVSAVGYSEQLALRTGGGEAPMQRVVGDAAPGSKANLALDFAIGEAERISAALSDPDVPGGLRRVENEIQSKASLDSSASMSWSRPAAVSSTGECAPAAAAASQRPRVAAKSRARVPRVPLPADLGAPLGPTPTRRLVEQAVETALDILAPPPQAGLTRDCASLVQGALSRAGALPPDGGEPRAEVVSRPLATPGPNEVGEQRPAAVGAPQLSTAPTAPPSPLSPAVRPPPLAARPPPSLPVNLAVEVFATPTSGDAAALSLSPPKAADTGSAPAAVAVPKAQQPFVGPGGADDGTEPSRKNAGPESAREAFVPQETSRSEASRGGRGNEGATVVIPGERSAGSAAPISAPILSGAPAAAGWPGTSVRSPTGPYFVPAVPLPPGAMSRGGYQNHLLGPSSGFWGGTTPGRAVAGRAGVGLPSAALAGVFRRGLGVDAPQARPTTQPPSQPTPALATGSAAPGSPASARPKWFAVADAAELAKGKFVRSLLVHCDTGQGVLGPWLFSAGPAPCSQDALACVARRVAQLAIGPRGFAPALAPVTARPGPASLMPQSQAAARSTIL